MEEETGKDHAEELGRRMVEAFARSMEEDVGEAELELLESTLEYLELKGVEEIQAIGFLPYEKAEVNNREVIFEDKVLALTLDDTDRETGERTCAAWIKEKD